MVTILIIMIAVEAVLATFGGIFVGMRATKLIQHSAERNSIELAEIHTMVDGNLTNLTARIDQLTQTLTNADITIPKADPPV